MLVLVDAGYHYASANQPALMAVNLHVQPGERVLVAGPSGGGKSTLLGLASGQLARHGQGQVLGQVRVDGEDPARLPPSKRATALGWVGQRPADQLFAGTVRDEVAFGPISLGWPTSKIADRVVEMLAETGLRVSPGRDPMAMSGGQQQRLAVAGALAGRAGLLLLDEPLARLDPPGAEQLLETLHRVSQNGVSVVMVEHRLSRCLPWCDRVVVVSEGRLQWQGAPADLPTEIRAILGLERASVRRWPGSNEVALDHVSQGVHFGQFRALEPLSLTLMRGELVSLVGPNGAGKSTLLGALSGRHTGRSQPDVIEVPQDPDLMLISATVRLELGLGPTERGVPADEVDRRVDEVAAALRLTPLLDRPPQGLSGGERLRVAVAAALCCRPRVLLLDEPTAGQDPGAIDALLNAIHSFAPDASVVVATHDLGLAQAASTRVMSLRAGAIDALGLPDQIAVLADERDPAAEAPVRDGLDPRIRLVLLLCVGTLAVLLDRPWALGLLAMMSAVMLLNVGLRAPWRRRAVALTLGVVWSTCLSQALFYNDLPRVALFEFGPVVFWREGVAHGLVQSLRMLAPAYAGVALALSTSPDRLLGALAAIRVPWTVGFLAATALRFVPLVAEETQVVRSAWSQRGRPVWRRTPWRWLALEVRLLQPVVARTLRRGRHLATSLDARGFDPDVARPAQFDPILPVSQRVLALLALSLVAAVAALELLYWAYLAEILYLPALRPLYGWVRFWL